MGDLKPPENGEMGVGIPDDSTALRLGTEFVVDRSARRLLRDEKRIKIQHKPLDVLIYLAQHRSRLVTREELLHEFWPRKVNEEALTRCISTIRKVLDDSQDPPRYIETLWGQGYRFIAPVTELPEHALPRRSTPGASPGGFTETQSVRFRARPWAAALLAGLLMLGLFGYQVWRSEEPVTAAEVDRIAVLPISAPGREEWIVSALTDELIQTIARIEGVAVMARGSVAQFSADSDPQDIGRILGVQAVLVSRLESERGVERLKSTLVSTADGSVLWNFNAEPVAGTTDAQQIRALADAAARRLWARLRLSDSSKRVNPAAYRHYLRGRYYWGQRSLTGLTAAIDSFEAALAIEPEYPEVLTGLSESWLLLPLYGAVEPNEAIPRARELAEQALRQDSAQSRAHAVLGVIHMQYDWNWLDAERRLIQAVTLNPNDSTAVQWLGELYCYAARFEECRRYLALAVGLDPLSPVLRMLQGSPDLYSGRYEAAAEQYRQTMKEIPEFVFASVAMGHAYMGLGAWGLAIDSYEMMLPDYGLEIVGGPLVFAHARKGDVERANHLLSELERLASVRYVPPSKLSVAHLGFGDKPMALAYLRQAVEAHDDRLVYLAVDSLFQELHSEPEFITIAKKLGIIEALERRWGGVASEQVLVSPGQPGATSDG